MRVDQIDSSDAGAFDAWYHVLHVTDQERWPDSPGWDHRTVKAMADRRGGAVEFLCFSAADPSGATVGIGFLQVPNWENRHHAVLEVRVLADRRRRHVGTALVESAERWAAAAGRSVLLGESEVPVAAREGDASTPFARHLGFVAAQHAHRRHLALPPEPSRIGPLEDEVASATAGYRMMAFTTPWPEQFVEDCCELQRCMSTDAPTGEAVYEEEVWNAARIKENDELLAAQGLVKVAAVAQHLDTGRLVAFSEIAVPEAHPDEGWQWATLVRREHRGHRLGLAVKLANLAHLRATFPGVRRIITGNAQENAPMIAVNEALGFEVAADQTMWQKRVHTPQ